MEKITAETIKALIAQKYQSLSNAGKYAIFFELKAGTGAYAYGAIDAFVMNVWPSSKYARYAFEIKVSRQDLMHELNHPEKRDWSMGISNEFWFVCAPGICTPDEIPENCGLMVVSKNGKMLRSLKRAQFRENQPLNLWEIASICRAASRMQNFPDTLIWRYSGQELNDEQLDRVIRERRKGIDQRDIENRAKELAKAMFLDQNSDMAKYAKAMQKAGIEPPDFMVGKSTGYAYDHTIQAWIERNLTIGPGSKEILSAMQQMKTAYLALNTARDSIIKLTENNKSDGGQETINDLHR